VAIDKLGRKTNAELELVALDAAKGADGITNTNDKIAKIAMGDLIK
jgi:hypothetical protein